MLWVSCTSILQALTSTRLYRWKASFCLIAPLAGLILRRCALDEEGIAYWEHPTYMKCVSNDYRSIQTLVRYPSVTLSHTLFSSSSVMYHWCHILFQTREHLSKAQRGLVGDGVSEVMTKLKVTSSDGTSYSGDLLAILDVLKNMTEIFRRAYYSPSSADMRVSERVSTTIKAANHWEMISVP